MRTANTVQMAGDLDHIVALAVDTERWPEILPHYRWVRLLEGDGDHKTVEMAARRDRIPVRWRAIQDVDRTGPTPVIRFRSTRIGIQLFTLPFKPAATASQKRKGTWPMIHPS